MSEVVGYDVDRTALGVAREALSEFPRTGSARVTLLDADEFLSSSVTGFDVVTIVDVMHHVPLGSRAEFLRNAFSRVSPGGCLVYKDMADTPRIFALTNYLHDLLLTGTSVTLSPIESVEELAASMGFLCEVSESHRRLWYAHEWRVFRRPL